MDIESIRIFLDVWHTGSITAASEINFMTQPALGKRIAALEKELGVSLFRRGKGQAKVELTPEGKAFCDIAERMILLQDQAMELKNDIGKDFLTIASIRSAHDFVVPEILLQMKRVYPNLNISVEEHHTAEIIDLLEKRRIDAGIIQAEAVSQNLKSRLLYAESYRVVLRPENRLSKEEHIDPKNLPAEHGIFQVFDSPYETWFLRHWNPYAVKIKVNTTPTAVRYFRECDDWMIVPEAVAYYMEKQGYISKTISGDVPVHYVYLCWNIGNHRAILKNFLNNIVSFSDCTKN